MDPRQSQAHMLILTGVIVTFLTVAAAQDWWVQLRYYIESRASKNPPNKPSDPNLPTTDATIKWLLGLAGVWIALTIMADLGDTAELAEALALVMMGSVLMMQGPKALSNLGFINGGQNGNS